MRDTDVQQPNTAATLSCVRSWRAFSANSGQFDAGSTTTGWILRPRTPPFALISSMVIRATSFSEVSLMAIVPESECRMPTLIGSAARLGAAAPRAAQTSKAMVRVTASRLFIFSPGLLELRLVQVSCVVPRSRVSKIGATCTERVARARSGRRPLANARLVESTIW